MDTVPSVDQDYSEEIPSPAESLSHESDHSIRTLLSWSSPGRPFKKRTKEFYLTTLLIAFLLEIILFLFSQYLLMMVVASLVFVSFAFAYVPPKNFHYRISTEGIRIEDRFYIWHELYDFYFTKRNGLDVLNVRTQAMFPGMLTVTLGDMDRNHVRDVIVKFLPYREYIKPSFMEKSGDWLSKNFPLERPTS